MDTRREHTAARGYVIIIASLMATIVVTLGVLLASFIRQDLSLSGSAEASDMAFYAATAADSCGAYYDTRLGDENPFSIGSFGERSITCMGVASAYTPQDGGFIVSGEEQVYQFDWDMHGQPTCSLLRVIKTYVSAENTQDIATDVVSRGYNVSCDQITSEEGVVERVIERNY